MADAAPKVAAVKRLPGGIASSPRRRAALALAAAALVAALVGGGLVVHAAWIPLKAELAQALLERAWVRAEEGVDRPVPWPWADTWPVARLRLAGGEPLVVLAGASGRTLAFGPGHLDGSARPGEGGNVVIAGHRDTHFRALRELEPGDRLELRAPDGTVRLYRVARAAVVHHTDATALAPTAAPRLTLVTCWPFDALHPGGPLRYVVVAEGEPGGAAAAARVALADEGL